MFDYEEVHAPRFGSAVGSTPTPVGPRKTGAPHARTERARSQYQRQRLLGLRAAQVAGGDGLESAGAGQADLLLHLTGRSDRDRRARPDQEVRAEMRRGAGDGRDAPETL